ncbi:MAG: adenylosuccinate synthase [Patescibacteria group bacterium]
MTQITSKLGQVTAVVGAQWGDEGKGKLVDILAESYDIVARATGGANAGHTIYIGDKKFVFHLVPAGMLHPGKICVMGNGMVVHLPTLLEELDVLIKAGIEVSGRLFLSDRAHLVFEYHKIVDKMQEEMKGGAKVGTTGRGIGPAYSDKTSRIGIRAGELLNFAEFEKHFRQTVGMLQKMYSFNYDIDAELAQIKKILPQILPLITDSSFMLDNALKAGKTILMEGANGVLLDIDHGTYPFVTSSNASLGGILAGSGVAPSKLKSAIGIMKAYFTRVGSGSFPTELDNELGESIRKAGAEFGATTGRPRRCGWFDAVAARYSQRINGYTAINLTKVDVLNSLPSIKIGIAYKCADGKRLTEFPADLSLLDKCEIEYEEMPGWQADTSAAKTFEDLPENCKKYIQRLEQLVGCPIMFIGTGRSREKMIVRF